MRINSSQFATQNTRQGSILLLVLVVVMLLSFSMYSFSELSLVQYQAAKSSLQEMKLRQAAESGIAVATDYLQQRDRSADNRRIGRTAASPFQQMTVASNEYGNTTCSVLKSIPKPGQVPNYGLADESARLNINGLDLSPEKRRIVRERLLQIPRMTNQTAAAILDWMDDDDETSDYGAESSWYASQFPSYQPRQARFAKFDELLLVRGVTFELLYGEDADADGILDRGEDKNSDGILQAGFSDFLTIDSAESTSKPDGSRKINLNSTNLADLYDKLEAIFDKDIATYVVAFRMKGREDDNDRRQEMTEDEKIEEREASAARRLAQQLGTGSNDNAPDLKSLLESEINQEVQVRNGLTLTSVAPYEVKSLVDLVGGFVRITVDLQDTLLKSPWQSDAASVRRALAQLRPHVTLTAEQRIRNRINVFEAPYEVLMTIPDMTESTALAILNSQRGRSNSSLTSRIAAPRRRSIAELVDLGIVDVRGLRQIAPFITAQGDVFRGVAIGETSRENRVIGIRFAIDATYPRPRLLSLHDLPPMPRFTPQNTTR